MSLFRGEDNIAVDWKGEKENTRPSIGSIHPTVGFFPHSEEPNQTHAPLAGLISPIQISAVKPRLKGEQAEARGALFNLSLGEAFGS